MFMDKFLELQHEDYQPEMNLVLFKELQKKKLDKTFSVLINKFNVKFRICLWENVFSITYTKETLDSLITYINNSNVIKDKILTVLFIGFKTDIELWLHSIQNLLNTSDAHAWSPVGEKTFNELKVKIEDMKLWLHLIWDLDPLYEQLPNLEDQINICEQVLLDINPNKS